MDSRIARRDFLKAAGVAAAGSLLPLQASIGADGARSRVAIAVSPRHAESGPDPDSSVVAALVASAVSAALGKAEAADAWRSVFSSRDKVAIKVNTLAGPALATRPEVVDAIVAGLLSAGVEGRNIVVCDRSERELERCGYRVGRAANGVSCAGTDSAGVGYGSEIITSGATASLWSNIISDFATAVISAPVLKDHDLSGVSLGLKNFFGVIHNPNKYHDNGCDPYIADVCSNPMVKGRLRLTVIDALTAQADGGPAFRREGNWRYAGVIAGADPVAVDAVGWREIEALRAKMGYRSLEAVGRKPSHILTAAQRGLGIADERLMDVVRVTV